MFVLWPHSFVMLLLLQAFGWRSMFVLLAGLSSLVILPLLLLCVPETLQYKVLQRLSKKQPAAALKVAEAATILGQVIKYMVL
jgi:predicted MFS family arabinose efflux permease